MITREILKGFREKYPSSEFKKQKENKMSCPSNEYFSKQLSKFLVNKEPFESTFFEHINSCTHCKIIIEAATKFLLKSPFISFEQTKNIIFRMLELYSIEQPTCTKFGQIWTLSCFGPGYLGIVNEAQIIIPGMKEFFVSIIPLDSNFNPANITNKSLFLLNNENKMNTDYLIQIWNETIVNRIKLQHYIQDIPESMISNLKKTMKDMNKLESSSNDEIAINFKGNISNFDKYKANEILKHCKISYDFFKLSPYFAEAS